MKRSFTLLKGLALVAAVLFSFNSKAAEGCETSSGSSVTEIFLTVPNDGTISASTILTLKTELSAANGERSAQIIQNFSPEGKETTERSVSFKDGKVDVDIIIRGSDLQPFLRPVYTEPVVKVRIASIISYITVDNISGVMTAGETGTGSSGIASRILDLHVSVEENSVEISDQAFAAFSLESHPGNLSDYQFSARKPRLTEADVVLYPNPAAGGNFNINMNNSDAIIESIQVFNTIGSLVYSNSSKMSSKGVLKMNLSDAPAGVYFIRITTDQGEIVKKFNITRF
ncbi:MAG: T9SS type A sorting domain-containing protein [Bacteroidetes bacterium]|nr:T9SS type A sorting domain-containing protein [Bacteroidota bacterium]